MAAMSVCVACMDEDEDVLFSCKGKGGTCSYQLCAGCVRIAFDDKSGASSAFCAMCKYPTAIEMIESLCGGKGAILAVEKELRGKLEFQMNEENARKVASRSNAKDTGERARHIFNQLSENINLKCPRCQAVFHDYDGCNALTCSIPDCRAAFCAICLKDCGKDAHQHVQADHSGKLFDKAAFEKTKICRAQAQISNLMEKLSHESFELKQLVQNHVEKAKLTHACYGTSDASAKKAQFLEKTKASLLLMTRNDRLALLSNPEEHNQRSPLRRDDISPRCAIPCDYRLSLIRLQGDLFQIHLEHNVLRDQWQQINDIEAHFKKNPKIDSLLNVSQALRCAVVAFEGQTKLYQSSRGLDITKGHKMAKNEVGIRLRVIGRDGNVTDDGLNHHGRITIIGLNQNNRMMMLERHVQETSDSDLMFEPLQHLIGAGKSHAVFTEMEMGIPDSQSGLNEQQKKVAHPLRLKTAMEVAGPPGTGKTKTIIELVRALLQCTSYDIILLSERNGAINAVAEKFKSESMKREGKKTEIKDLQVWTSVMAYGAGDTMGEHTKLFTLDEKLKSHPELAYLQEKRNLHVAASKDLSQAMREKLADIVRRFGNRFNEILASNRSQLIEGTQDASSPLTSPLSIIGEVNSVVVDIKATLAETNGQSSKYISEHMASDLVVRHSNLLGRLIFIRPDSERGDKESDPWDAKEATRRLCYILDRFGKALDLEIFCPDNARDLYQIKTAVDEEYKALFERTEEELPILARLHMSTIGSSHRLPGDKKSNDASLSRTFGQLKLNHDDSDNDDQHEPPKETIFIFDESGCIPAYELLGLSRLGRSIKALILVGDKKQLPPYDPMQGRRSGRGNSFNANGVRRSIRPDKMCSLLDSSALTIDSGKVMLTVQYRIPLDLAEMLNRRVYRGQYNTCPNAGVPISGLRMVDVPWAESPRKKYVNPNEVDRGLRLLNELSLEHGISSTLVITPYKNQQREFEFQIGRLKKQGHSIETTVLTIDQCQGQEADAVILSLVRKPTRFLTLNRLNVALSRVRRKLYVLTDFKDLREACQDGKFESASLAGDLLIGSI